MLRDQSTGLPTKELLLDRMELTMLQHKRLDRKAVLMLLESPVPLENDFLQVVSQRILYAIRNTDTVAMVDTYTFAILLTDLVDSENALRVADSLIQRCQQPYQKAGKTLRYRPSIGLSVYPDDASSVTEWLFKSEKALAVAKSESNGIYKFYNEDMNVRANKRKVMTVNMQKAWSRREFSIYGQPVFDNKSACQSVELLLRWIHPEDGVIAAEQFADIAQSSGLWISACDLLIDVALESSKKFPNIKFSWNAPYQIDGRYTDDMLPLANLKKFDGNHAHIGLEIPERLLYEREDIALEWSRAWSDAGGSVSLDKCGKYPIHPKLWDILNIVELKTDEYQRMKYLNSLATSYNWNLVIKNLLFTNRYNLPSNVFIQSNFLHEAAPIEELLHSELKARN